MRENYLKELQKEGIVVIENFFTKKKCDKIIKQIEDFSYKEKIIKQRDEGLGGDLRIFGFEKFSSDASDFSNNDFFSDQYIFPTKKKDSVTLAYHSWSMDYFNLSRGRNAFPRGQRRHFESR